MKPKVAFLGLGAMGYPMACNLQRAGFPTLVWNRTAKKAEEHASACGTTAASLEAAAMADVIFSCLPTSAEVAELVARMRPHLHSGSVWVDCTSGDPEASRRIARDLSELGVAFLDAPVSGGTTGAEEGTLTVMVGGSEETFERVRPVLEAVGRKIVHVGPVGAGHALKAVNNTLLAVNLWAAGEGLAALVKQGVDPRVALAVINASSGRSNATENLIPERVVTRAWPNTFKLGLLTKDVGIGMKVLDGADLPAPVLRLTYEVYQMAKREIGPDADHAEALKLIERWAGTEIS
ncbi:6-phosphogluconate dehydrogenase NAD-binding protein [Oceanithermus profundus DSM 14977]|uniref:6-phosphogluconate dehydrogenase NAD-binding protein n=1 Tax=Oceanithermus profundus (strain DSM 14977 / NBRC 100410 / VKM B-2274 / 506) TaxID=670487 RepID=E4U9R2_OCEP5|nr:NAD(P)-dependent oxidoreductase [Oceanithermus profundus]ADR37226.1 6-phosphogluconate dehydrogenase NAD-binding protein [Oceanithermus profundus DSM 14977]